MEAPEQDEDDICHKCNRIAMEQSQGSYEALMLRKRGGSLGGGKEGKLKADGSVRRPYNINHYVYGSGSVSKKARRCGECEGCMREECGHCAACKVKFITICHSLRP